MCDGNALRALRKERGLTQREVADGAGVTPNTIVKMERDGRTTMATLRKVTTFLATKPVDPLIAKLLNR